MSEGRSSVSSRGVSVDDAIVLFVNKQVFSGWKNVSIDRKINEIASSFTLELTDKWTIEQKPIRIRRGDRCHIHIGKKTVLDGYVDSVDLSIDGTNRTISVSGRSISLDLVDCSYDGISQFKDTTMENIVEKILAPFNVPFRFNSPGGQFKKIDIRQGETIGEVIDRMAREKKLIVYNSFGGTLIFDVNGSRRASTEIIQGINLLTGSVSRSDVDRFSEYKVKGQTDGVLGLPVDATKNTGTAKDSGISRYRPMLIVAENSVNQDGAKKRAEYEASKRSAEATKFSVSVQGWYQKDDQLWDINQIVGLRAPYLEYSGDLLIDSVGYRKSSSGTVCLLGLVRKDAYLFAPTVPKEDTIYSEFAE